MLPISDYDSIIIAFSAGKDSTAAFLHLLESGVPLERIELWHHEVDGREGSKLMDWPSTPPYCRAFAADFKVPLYFSWREGGFEREMTRNQTPTAPVHWENPDGTIGVAGGKGPLGTRLKFPQVSSNLAVRWCSPALKIDACSAALRNQDRFSGKKTLLVSGERAEESPCRARYKVWEEDRTNAKKRLVHRWRPVHAWKESEDWAILERHLINPHPAYRLGLSRLSCKFCIFNQADGWASLREIDPDGFGVLVGYEQRFGVTIHRTKSLMQLANAGKPFFESKDSALIEEAADPNWNRPIRLTPGTWKLPAGAFKGHGGPS